MTATPWLRAAFTIAAAFAQTIRNSMRCELTAGRTSGREPIGMVLVVAGVALLILAY